ncbi:hypothetical protein ISF_02656 [Cordyceps fumosorosea ARSEF 2679]|uniref:Uncharacterized protein n=1 Tax=Cordyceps fumosorosea (strain ARSEF 2679) TaxID=1081104 RepID=A0A162JLF5_CORFA|nr:hypothetical protein ISF_02656 [Cordyceps fumosorosea ARSEF 2679]OAA70682.1 hypothetical protein ISF_02656 [Cordyceps fumosorosea ARSEF 2679]
MSSTAGNDAPSRPGPNILVSAASRLAANYVAPYLDSRIPASTVPFAQHSEMLPHRDSRWWGWTHYGIFLPGLPEPYRFLNLMTFIGATGTACFDNDYLAAADARHTATVLSATAYGEHHHYEAYDAVSGCDFRADGSRLTWGAEDLVLECAYPEYKVAGRFGHMSVDLAIRTTDQVSYFTKMPIYDHFSVLATYDGTVKDVRGTTRISGMCTVEYARCITPQVLARRPLSPSLKLPVTFFTYQIVNLDERTQLLLTKVTGAGATLCLLAHLRTLDGGAARVFPRTELEILEYADKRLVDDRGRSMRVPKRMRWTVDDDEGAKVVRLEADVDAPFRYGHGQGYVSAYTFQCIWGERSVKGTGYLEWIDVEG